MSSEQLVAKSENVTKVIMIMGTKHVETKPPPPKTYRTHFWRPWHVTKMGVCKKIELLQSAHPLIAKTVSKFVNGYTHTIHVNSSQVSNWSRDLKTLQKSAWNWWFWQTMLMSTKLKTTSQKTEVVKKIDSTNFRRIVKNSDEVKNMGGVKKNVNWNLTSFKQPGAKKPPSEWVKKNFLFEVLGRGSWP